MKKTDKIIVIGAIDEVRKMEQARILKLIKDKINDYSERLMKNRKLPDLVQANLSGCILALKDLKSEIEKGDLK